MSPLLEVPAIRARVKSLSVDEYHRLGELPVELLRGTLIQKMSKSPLHQSTIDELRAILAEQIQPGWVLRQDGPLTLADSEPEPDLCVTAGTRADFRSVHPRSAALVVEVAVSSLEIDRVKALIYAEAGVAEYWIVCPDERRVEVYRGASAAGYTEQLEMTAPGLLRCAKLPELQVDLAVLFP